MLRSRIAAFAATAVLCCAQAAPGAPSNNLFNDVLVARGKGVEVRRGALDDAFIAYKVNLSARGADIPEERRLQTEAQLLDRLIISQLLVQKATAADKAKAQERVVKLIEDSVKTAGSEGNFTRQLKVLGLTPQQFTNRVNEQAIAEELISRDVKSKITITPEQVQRFYETNDAAFRQPEIARASHILILTRDPNTRMELNDEQKKVKREKAEKILVQARKGDDFAKLVMEYSDDLASRERKGEYKFTRAKDNPRQAMAPEFEAAAFNMRPGEISNLVTTEYGYHIIKLHELTPARKVPLDEVEKQIREMLLNIEAEKQFPSYFAGLKKEAEVEILDSRLAEALSKTQSEANK